MVASVSRHSLKSAIRVWLAGALVVPVIAQAGPQLWISDSSNRLGFVDLDTQVLTSVGNLGVLMVDLAFDPLGQLYGIGAGNLYRINTTTAAPTLVGSLGGAAVNSLVFSPAGTLFAASDALYSVNTNTGFASFIGRGGIGYASSGDLAFVGGALYLSSRLPNADTLVQLNAASGAATSVGAFGVSQVWGLASTDGVSLHGTTGRTVLSINPATGTATSQFTYGNALGPAFGTAFLGEAAPVPELGSPTMFLAGMALLGVSVNMRRRRQLTASTGDR